MVLVYTKGFGIQASVGCNGVPAQYAVKMALPLRVLSEIFWEDVEGDLKVIKEDMIRPSYHSHGDELVGNIIKQKGGEQDIYVSPSGLIQNGNDWNVKHDGNTEVYKDVVLPENGIMIPVEEVQEFWEIVKGVWIPKIREDGKPVMMECNKPYHPQHGFPVRTIASYSSDGIKQAKSELEKAGFDPEYASDFYYRKDIPGTAAVMRTGAGKMRFRINANINPEADISFRYFHRL